MTHPPFDRLVLEMHQRVGTPLTAGDVPPGLIEAIGDATVILDWQFQVVAANRRSCELFQIPSPSLALGRTIFEFLPPSSLPGLVSILSQLLSGRDPVVELAARRDDGRDLILEVRTTIANDRAGAIAGFVVTLRDVTRLKIAEEPLGLILEGTSRATGDAFFHSLVECLSKALGMRYALVGKIVGATGDRIETAAVWYDGALAPNVGYRLADTPCAVAVTERICVHPAGVQEAFPADELLVEMNAESYVGARLMDSSGTPVGVLAVLDTRPLERSGMVQSIMQLFAARAAAEFERLRYEEALRASDERFATAVSGTSDGLFDVNLETDIAWVSPRCAELLGYSGPSGLPGAGTGLRALIHPDDLPAGRDWPGVGDHRSEFGSPPSATVRIRHRKGEYRWFELRDSITRDSTGKPIRHLGFLRDVTDTRRLERLLAHTSRIAQVGGWELEADTGQVRWTDETYRVFGTTPGELRPSLDAIRGFFDQETWSRLIDALSGSESPAIAREITARITKASGDPAWVRILISAEMQNGRVGRWLGAIQDITAFRQLEEQLFASQKLEGIGRLAGGVAHDFNNLLTAILGACDIAADAIPSSSAALVELAEIRRAAVSASLLTKQLLAFGRRSPVAPRSVHLDLLLLDVEGLLERIIGADIDLTVATDSDLWPVLADPGQIEQVIVNLAVNARDAMPEGGRLELKAVNSRSAAPSGLDPGDYVLLTVTDTGHGMTAEVKSRIFEPFFTTKQPGHGTGLGLATCHGIVAQAGGAMAVTSSPGLGTKFEIHLPRSVVGFTAGSPRMPAPARGSETILVVEDEPGVRRSSRLALERLGYRVLEAGSSAEAIAISGAADRRPELLVIDVMLPGPGGLETAATLGDRIPGVRVLYTTGYLDEALERGCEGAAVLQKPFTLDELGRRVREVLDRVKPAAPEGAS